MRASHPHHPIPFPIRGAVNARILRPVSLRNGKIINHLDTFASFETETELGGADSADFLLHLRVMLGASSAFATHGTACQCKNRSRCIGFPSFGATYLQRERKQL